MTFDSNTDNKHEDAEAPHDSTNDTTVTGDNKVIAASNAAAPSGEALKPTDKPTDKLEDKPTDTPAPVTDHSEDTTQEAVAVATDEAAETGDKEAEESDESLDGEEPESVVAAAAETGPRQSGVPAKAVAAILVIVIAVISLIVVQVASSKSKSYNLSKVDMEALFQELAPNEQATIASSPEEKKKLLDYVRERLSIAAFAEGRYADNADIQSELALQSDGILNQTYRKLHPDVSISDDEINAYYQQHPTEFDSLLKSNPRFQQQAQGPRGEQLKKDYGQFKVIAERALKDKLDRDDTTRVLTLLQRSEVIRKHYLDDLQKDPQLVSDAEVNQYYEDHKTEFEEIRVRHVLIATQPPPPPPPPPPGSPEKKEDQPKVLSKEEARKKAEEVLAKARKGEDFAALAKQYSDDPGSKDKGGEYDFFPRGQMVAEFDKAAFALQPGQISEIVETKFGYHIIKLEERRLGSPADPKTHQGIIDKLKTDKIDAAIKNIVDKSGVVIAEDFTMTVKAPEPQQLPAGHPAVPNDR